MGCGEVHNIGAGGQHADVLEARKALDGVVGQRGFVGQKNVGFGGTGQQFSRGGAVMDCAWA